jgi:hypothetical protein
MNAVAPWMSELDIDKGERWNSVIADVLNNSKVGIFCVTPDNVSRPAILFEAGAISKSVTDARTCVLLEGMQSSDLSWPWAQFQATRLHDQKDMFKMLCDLNRWVVEAGEPGLSPEHFQKQLGMWWPQFQAELQAKPAEAAAHVPQRSDKDMLVEILELLRSQKRESASFEMITAEIQKARVVTEERAKEQLAAIEARVYQEGLNVHSGLKDAMASALSREGHETASKALLQSSVRVTADRTCLVLVPMRQSMTKLTFNAEAELWMLKAAHAAGFAVRTIAVRAFPPTESLPPLSDSK